MVKQTYTFDLMDSTLLLAAKGWELVEIEKIPEEIDGNELSDYPQLMQFYQKNINTAGTFSHREARKYFVQKIGDFLIQIDPERFKRAVYQSQGIQSLRDETLLAALIHQIRTIPKEQLILDTSLVGY